MKRIKPKQSFNARFEQRVHDAIDAIAECLETTKTGAVKYAVLTTVERLKSREPMRELKVEYDD